MTDLKSLEARLDAALTALEKAAAPRAAPDSGAPAARIAELEAENRALEERLAAVTDEREKDLAQLDALIAQLRPLIEEAV